MRDFKNAIALINKLAEIVGAGTPRKADRARKAAAIRKYAMDYHETLLRQQRALKVLVRRLNESGVEGIQPPGSPLAEAIAQVRMLFNLPIEQTCHGTDIKVYCPAGPEEVICPVCDKTVKVLRQEGSESGWVRRHLV